MSEIYNGTFVLGNTSATQIVAGEGIKIDTTEPGVIKVSNDETVLWEGNCGFGNTLTASEPITGFESYKVYLVNTERQQQVVLEKFVNTATNTAASNNIVTLECIQAGWSDNTFLTFNIGNGQWNNTWTQFNYNGGYAGYWYASTWNYLPLQANFLPVIQKIIGINRKQNGGN